MWKHYQEDRTAARPDSHMPLASATLMYSAPKDAATAGRTEVARLDEEAEQASVHQGFAYRRGQNVRRRQGAGKPALYTQDV